MNMRPNQTTGCPGRTHRFFSGTPVFAFGEGMGYSRMEYSAVTARVVGSESASSKPSSQMAHSEELSHANVPTGHSAHSELPAEFAALPGSQWVHE